MSRPSPSSEARIVDTKQVLIALSKLEDDRSVEGFCGTVLREPSAGLPDLSGKTVYLAGDLANAEGLDLRAAARVLVLRELSRGPVDGDGARWPVVDLGRLPVSVHGLGVYYRRFFEPTADAFHGIQREHAFQSLTESNKPSKAHRTGIYLTPVRREGEALHFHLLRCSTNLSGPTENFRATDRHIVDALNQEAAFVFEDQAPLNHVLAQLYHNTPADHEKGQAKARISAHADKTKDMPDNGIMVFCTFYDHLDALRPLPDDPFDLGHAGTSGLTRLRFRWKGPEAPPDARFPATFTITLYPDSAFFMPLSTNRLYTHEIQPGALPASRLPTRLGYVVRCSNAEAVHEDGRTYLAIRGERVELQPPTPEGMLELRQRYAEENRTQSPIDYGDGILFSMNEGDYRAPGYEAADEFRAYTLPSRDDLFAELHASAPFEDAGKGRRGAVLVATDDPRGTPIVRTTTAYARPARGFQPVHERLSRRIRGCASLGAAFNNALIETYTSAYTTMGAHSDLALDLDDPSEIAIFSCYERPVTDRPPRRLLVESKEPGGPQFAIPLTHHGVVVFSVDTNRRFRHRIVLDPSAPEADNPWLGVTFRTSRTFVRARDGRASFPDDTLLTLASEEERRAFLQLRRRENQETGFRYPRISYTLSPSDLLLSES